MRHDIAKVLVERPRRGGCGKQRIRQNRHQSRRDCQAAIMDDGVEVANYRGMKRVHSSNGHGDTKELNENLAPLIRFLRSRVGKKWDDIYSEIMENLNLNNATQYHVWQHLIKFKMVELNTFMQDGRVMAYGGGGEPYCCEEGKFYFSSSDEFYVHPETDKLCLATKNKSRRWNYKRKNDPPPHKENDPLTQYHTIKGIWYEVKFRRPTKEEEKAKAFFHPGEGSVPIVTGNKLIIDLTGKEYFHEPKWWYGTLWTTCKEYFGDFIYPISKRQLSSKEIKALKRKQDATNN